MLVSIVIRTLNEETYLTQVLEAVEKQKTQDVNIETIIVDSGSTDGTLAIARKHGCRITHIAQDDFTFGRSLNQGCDFADGDILVFLSGHCIPCDHNWLQELIAPIRSGICEYCYGRQIGSGPTKFSENRVFLKYYPLHSLLPQEGFFANNANAALLKETWEEFQFDESLTGLEDMHLAKRLVGQDKHIGYASGSSVYHIHDESWSQVRNRYEREGIALADIMPEASLSFIDFITVTARSIAKDSYAALRQQVFMRNVTSIFLFRTLQYWGSYRGTRIARLIASSKRKSYFYPDRHFEKPKEKAKEDVNGSSRAASYESAQ